MNKCKAIIISINTNSCKLGTAQCSKIGKKVQFQKNKKHFSQFQKWQKIIFCTRKNSENCIFGNFKLFSCAKMNFSPFLKMQIMVFCTYEIALFSNFRALCILFHNEIPYLSGNENKNISKFLIFSDTCKQ